MSDNLSPAILLTGSPGVGKSTIIQGLVDRLGPAAGGFYTRELRQAGQRVGFEIVTLAGQREVLATTDPGIPFIRAVPFGRYRVNLAALDALVVPALRQASAEGRVVVVDEIGPMELLSSRFGQIIWELLDGPAVIVGTIVRRRHPLADRVKVHPRVMVVEVTPANRDTLPAHLYAELGSLSNRTGVKKPGTGGEDER